MCLCFSKGHSAVESSVPPALVAFVANTLKWTYFLERYRPGMMDAIAFTTKLSRIMCTFLTGINIQPTV